MGLSGDEIEYELENIFGGNRAAASGGEEDDDDEEEEAAHERRIAALRGGGNGKGKGRQQEETRRVEWDVGAKASFRPRYNVSCLTHQYRSFAASCHTHLLAYPAGQVAPTTQCVVVTRKGALEATGTSTNEAQEAVYQINLMVPPLSCSFRFQ